MKEVQQKKLQKHNRRNRPYLFYIFEVMKLNLEANNYEHLIEWPKVITELRIMYVTYLDLNDENIRKFSAFFLCHTQAAKRGVKLITKASSNMCGKENWDDIVLVT